jgi:hypothetical protein
MNSAGKAFTTFLLVIYMRVSIMGKIIEQIVTAQDLKSELLDSKTPSETNREPTYWELEATNLDDVSSFQRPEENQQNFVWDLKA